jgi:N-acetylglutamate synthase-like GNAT family acetyltransferase
VLFNPHKENEATLQRLAIKTEYQDHGLSTILIKRVILWAHSHKIEHLFATTDELQNKMADILSKRHGFQKVSVKKTGFYSYETLWKLDVKEWAENFTKERADEQSSAAATAAGITTK